MWETIHDRLSDEADMGLEGFPLLTLLLIAGLMLGLWTVGLSFSTRLGR